MGLANGLRPTLRWQITSTVAVIVIAGGAAAVAKWPHAWWWLIMVTVAAAAAAPLALKAISEAAEKSGRRLGRQEQRYRAQLGMGTHFLT